MAFNLIADGDAVLAPDLNQIIMALIGTAGAGQLIRFNALNDPASPILIIKNLDPAYSEGLRVEDAAGNYLLVVNKTGVHAPVIHGNVVNVYNATDNGVDPLNSGLFNSAALNALITTASAAGPAIIHMPAGVYNFAKTPAQNYGILLKSGVQLVGAGPLYTKLVADYAGDGDYSFVALDSTVNSYWTGVQGCWFHGAGGTSTPSLAAIYYRTDVTSTTHHYQVRVTDNKFTGACSSAIALEHTEHFVIERNWVVDPGRHCCYLSVGAEHGAVRDNHFDGSGTIGGATLASLVFRNAKYVDVYDNEIENADAAGIIFYPGDDQLALLYGYEGIHIHGNRIHNNTTLGIDGYGASLAHVSIHDNDVYSNGTQGMYLYCGHNNNVSRNHVYRNGDAGMSLGGVQKSTFEDNICESNGLVVPNKDGMVMNGYARTFDASFSLPTSLINSVAGNFFNFNIGEIIHISGTASNNGAYLIVDKATNYNIRVTPALVTEASVATTFTRYFRDNTVAHSQCHDIQVAPTQRYGIHSVQALNAPNLFIGNRCRGNAIAGFLDGATDDTSHVANMTGTAPHSGQDTLVAGTVTITTAAVRAAAGYRSRISLYRRTLGGAPGALYVSAITDATSFVITSTNAGDTSTVLWEISN